MLLLFDHSDQSILVKCVGQMDMYRCHLLGLRCPITCRIVHQPNSYIPSDVLLRCQQDNGQPFARWCGPWLALIIVVVAVVLCLSWWWDDHTRGRFQVVHSCAAKGELQQVSRTASVLCHVCVGHDLCNLPLLGTAWM